MNAHKINFSSGFIGLGFLILVVMSSSGCLRNREAFYFGSYSEAERLFSKGEFDKAIQKYQAYIDENPEGNLAIISQYYIARSHAALGHKDEALQLFRQIIEKHPDVIWANFSDTQVKELENAPKTEAPVETTSDFSPAQDDASTVAEQPETSSSPAPAN